jgi:general stress protein YciG
MPLKRPKAANGRCQATTKAGRRCAAPAVRGGNYCSLHSDPSRAVELGRKGGRRRTNYSPEGLKKFPSPKNAADLRDLLAQSIVELRAGELDPRVANAISYLGTGFLRTIEVADVEARLQALERELQPVSDSDGDSEEQARTSANDGGSECIPRQDSYD